MIRMTHPTIGTHVDVPEAAVEAWAAQGWLRPEPEPVEVDAPPVEPAPRQRKPRPRKPLATT